MADIGERPGEASSPPPLFLDQTDARRDEKKFLWDRASPYLRVWMTVPPLISLLPAVIIGLGGIAIKSYLSILRWFLITAPSGLHFFNYKRQMNLSMIKYANVLYHIIAQLCLTQVWRFLLTFTKGESTADMIWESSFSVEHWNSDLEVRNFDGLGSSISK